MHTRGVHIRGYIIHNKVIRCSLVVPFWEGHDGCCLWCCCRYSHKGSALYDAQRCGIDVVGSHIMPNTLTVPVTSNAVTLPLTTYTKPPFPVSHMATVPYDALSKGTAPHDVLSTVTTPYDALSTGTTPYDDLSTGTTPYDALSTGTTPYDALSTGTTPYDDLSKGTAPHDVLSTVTTPYDALSTGTTPYDDLSTIVASETGDGNPMLKLAGAAMFVLFLVGVAGMISYVYEYRRNDRRCSIWR